MDVWKRKWHARFFYRNGKVICGDNEQSNVPHIYAIGDILDGKLELTPVAIQAGRLLAQVLIQQHLKNHTIINQSSQENELEPSKNPKNPKNPSKVLEKMNLTKDNSKEFLNVFVKIPVSSVRKKSQKWIINWPIRMNIVTAYEYCSDCMRTHRVWPTTPTFRRRSSLRWSTDALVWQKRTPLPSTAPVTSKCTTRLWRRLKWRCRNATKTPDTPNWSASSLST